MFFTVIFFCLVAFLVALAFLGGITWASIMEWCVHRYIMHRRIPWFSYPFEKHALVHHRVFGSNHTYHLIDEKDKKTIPMAWWNGPALIIAATSPFILIGLALGLSLGWWLAAVSLSLLIGTVCAGYYGAYEYLHWCMHLPKGRWFEDTRVFQWLDHHHLLHHKWQGKNLNVVCPIADYFFGTLVFANG
jgi:hypothetical protein